MVNKICDMTVTGIGLTYIYICQQSQVNMIRVHIILKSVDAITGLYKVHF